ncbi:MAG: 3-oxoacid CoA-transferase subunit B [Propionibacteriaceae bacterium]|nr:3-oxoacid CoA-transferase subunit B [Propionibacteriaceae bacterium]
MTAADRTVENLDRPPLDSSEMAARVARDVLPGSYVNLGIGLPTRVADFLNDDAGVTLHTENGMLGMGPYAVGDQIDPELINAGKIPVTELLGASYFHHADAFAMMRGGHIDLCVMGAYQVTPGGDLANWSTGKPDAIPAVGGAMDLAVGAKSIYVMMDLFTKDGHAKLVQSCSYPLTGVACVDRIYSDLAVINLDHGHAVVWETYGISVDELRTRLDVPVYEL